MFAKRGVTGVLVLGGTGAALGHAAGLLVRAQPCLAPPLLLAPSAGAITFFVSVLRGHALAHAALLAAPPSFALGPATAMQRRRAAWSGLNLAFAAIILTTAALMRAAH